MENTQNLPDYIVYTDGGCAINPGGHGAYAAIIIHTDTGEIEEYNWNFFSRILLIGGDNNMTNNKLSKLETENYKKEDYHEKKEVPIYCKLNLTLKEAALYSNIGINKLNSLTSDPDCPFVLFIGHKKLIKRKPFEDFINNEFTQSL